ncbi:hypothetical protein FZ046_13660 [Mycolicibacterium grossiae]|nr:hypothetical protein FZ046_13660 [Mycolicibacterium grossiae]
MSDSAGGRRRNWRHRENRRSTAFLSKRVSHEDHDLIVAYAKSLDVSVAALLDPAIQELLSRARVHFAQTSVERADHQDSN